MKENQLFQVMNKVDDRYYEEAEAYTCKTHRWGRGMAVAACAALVLAGVLSAVWPEKSPTGNVTPSPGTAQTITLFPNESAAPSVVTNNIALMWEDYAPMTYEELLDYFQTDLPVTQALPQLTRKEGTYGVYQSEERGAYYDGNAVVFESGDGTQRLQVVLSKVFKHTSDVFQLTGDQLASTPVKNRDLAVFHYTDEAGQSCYYAEFIQHDVAFQVEGENLSEEEYAMVLETLVDPAQQEEEVHRLVGSVIATDSYTNDLGILLDGEEVPQYSRGYSVHLPEGLRVEDFTLGDVVEVTYTGEPATICTVWEEQFVDIQLLR